MLSAGFCGAGTEGNGRYSNDFPFGPGERLIYELHWGMIPAGEAELEILPMAEIGDDKAWHFRLSIRSNEFIDVFYKVRDLVESFVDSDLKRSLRYIKSQHEGKTLRESQVFFDHAAGTATYSNFGEVSPPIKIAEGTIDPLAAVFFIRRHLETDKRQIARPITDGKKNVEGVARVNRREKVEIDGVVYDTFQVEPDLKDVRGVFEKSDKSRIILWFTADEKRLLVKIKSKVIVGSFTGTLVGRP